MTKRKASTSGTSIFEEVTSGIGAILAAGSFTPPTQTVLSSPAIGECTPQMKAIFSYGLTITAKLKPLIDDAEKLRAEIGAVLNPFNTPEDIISAVDDDLRMKAISLKDVMVQAAPLQQRMQVMTALLQAEIVGVYPEAADHNIDIGPDWQIMVEMSRAPSRRAFVLDLAGVKSSHMGGEHRTH